MRFGHHLEIGLSESNRMAILGHYHTAMVEFVLRCRILSAREHDKQTCRRRSLHCTHSKLLVPYSFASREDTSCHAPLP